MSTHPMGAAFITQSFSDLEQWVEAGLLGYDLEFHGDRYRQKFLGMQVENGPALCFFVITGYDTPSENRAFEHAEFVWSGFLEALYDEAPKGPFIAFADVGAELEVSDFVASSHFENVDEGLGHFGLSRSQVADLQQRALGEGVLLHEPEFLS